MPANSGIDFRVDDLTLACRPLDGIAYAAIMCPYCRQVAKAVHRSQYTEAQLQFIRRRRRSFDLLQAILSDSVHFTNAQI